MIQSCLIQSYFISVDFISSLNLIDGVLLTVYCSFSCKCKQIRIVKRSNSSIKPTALELKKLPLTVKCKITSFQSLDRLFDSDFYAPSSLTMAVRTLLCPILFLLQFFIYTVHFYLYNCIRAFYYYAKYGPLFVFLRSRFYRSNKLPLKKIPRSLGILLPPNSTLIPSSLDVRPECKKPCARLSSQLVLSPLGAFLQEARWYGIDRVVVYMYAKDFSCIEKEPVFQSQIKPLEPFLTVRSREIPDLSDWTRAEDYLSFIERNAAPIDLVITYESALRLFGLAPMSLINSEFVDASWCSFRPFSSASLLAALSQFSKCSQRFGK